MHAPTTRRRTTWSAGMCVALLLCAVSSFVSITAAAAHTDDHHTDTAARWSAARHQLSSQSQWAGGVDILSEQPRGISRHPRTAAARNLQAGTDSQPSPPFCPKGPWLQSGRVDATDPACGLVGDGVTDNSDALAQCLQLVANCTRHVFFPPGRYWLARTVVLSHGNGTQGIRLSGSGREVSYLCKCANCTGGPSAPNFDQCGPSAGGLRGPRGPVIQVGAPESPHGTDGIQIDGFTIRGVDLGVHIVNSAGVSMARSEVLAGAYDGGDMDAAMIITNGFEFYFEEMAFWGGNAADYKDCEGRPKGGNASKCHSSPSVILRGVGAPNTTHFPLGGRSPPFHTATAFNSTGLSGAYGTPYVYMIRFERTLFDFGGVQYQQWTDLDQVAVVWHHYLTCFSESAGTPLLDFVSAPWVKSFRIEGVTVSDYSNWDEFSDDAIVRLNASETNHLLDGLTIAASSGGTSHSAVEVISGKVVGTTLQNGHWYGTDDVRTADGAISGTFVGRSTGGQVHVGELESLIALRKENSSKLSGESGHTLLMGVGGEENARFAMDADGVALHGPGGDKGFDTIVHPPKVLVVDWDPPALAPMAVASHRITVSAVRPGALCTVSHESTALSDDIDGAGTLLWSAQVSGSEEVTVVVFNASPQNVDLPAGPMRLMVTHVDQR